MNKLAQFYWDIRQDEKDDVNHEDEAVAKMERLLKLAYQRGYNKAARAQFLNPSEQKHMSPAEKEFIARRKGDL